MTSVFSLLHPNIQQMLRKENIVIPTEPQKKAIEPILKGLNVLLIAPTGHGKTEAALLPIFHCFLKQREQAKIAVTKHQGISILYITPLRALNRDMLRRTLKWGKELDISIAVRHGDTSANERARQSRYPPNMLITTPETLQIMFTGKRLRNHLQSVRWVIIDEIHELVRDERGAQLAVGLERLIELTSGSSQKFQRIGLSATVGSAEEAARFLGGMENNRFREVTILEVDVMKHVDLQVELPDIQKEDYVKAAQLSIEPRSFSSLRRCKELIDNHVSTLVFINTRDGAEILASRFHLWKPEMPIGIHHGSLSKQARIEAEDLFKEGRLRALICTSSLELGIDVGNTDFVIQYNSPREVTRIIQRIGRSGHRVGKTSKGVIIATNPEDLAESLVIARRTMQKEFEAFKVRQNPLSVLSNQIIAIALEYGKISDDQVYQIITRAYPFYMLKRARFDAIVEQLTRQRTIWKENQYLGKRRNSRKYFLDNISMIPDEKTFMAVDISTRKKVGKLDESFVLNSGFEGARFILRGRPWVIVKREDEEILVAQSREIGDVPSWTGEDIPVPFEVAREVGRLRRLVRDRQNISGYPCSSNVFQHIIQQIEDQQKQGFVVPDDKTITIEVDDRLIIINACFGTKVNETIGRLLSALLAQSIGESIGITNDPYRIHLELPVRLPPERIKDLLYSMKPESLWYLLHTILRNSTYVRWQLIHVARKFGAISKDFDYKNVGIKKLITLFDQTLIFDEAVDKLIWERMDIDHTKQVLEEIQRGDIQLVIQRVSPIALAGTETMRGLMVPQRADRTILMMLKKRLEESRVTMICLNCHKIWHTTAGRVSLQPKCSRCRAIKIAVVPRYDKDSPSLLQKKQLTTKEQHELKRLSKNASLVLSYGRPAVLALVGRGIGPDTAARILRMYDPLELEKSEEILLKFLRDIHKAEIQYARTRGFWDT